MSSGRRSENVDVEFVRSVADEPKRRERDDVNVVDRHYGGAPTDDVPVGSSGEADEARESREWEKRYGTEESRDRLGFDGLGEK